MLVRVSIFPLLLVTVLSSCYTIDDKTQCIGDFTSSCKGDLVVADSSCISPKGFEANDKITSFHFITHTKITVGSGAFYGDYNMLNFTADGGIGSLGKYSFSGSGITTLDITGITTIPKDCFSYSELKQLVGFESVTSIAENAFCGTKITSLNLSDNYVLLGKNAFAQTKLNYVKLPHVVKTIEDSVFAYCLELREIDINGANYITNGMFSGCKNLEKIHHTENVTQIGMNAFYQCTLVETFHFYRLKKVLFDFSNAKFLFYHNTFAPLEISELNQGLKVFVPDTYNSSHFGNIGVQKSTCDRFHYIDTKNLVADEKVICSNCPPNTINDDGLSNECPINMTQCLSIHKNCKICIDTNCELCDANLLVQNDGCVSSCGVDYITFLNRSCVSVCPNNFFKNGTTCSQCKENCQKCVDSNTCNQCDDNYYFLNESCYEECPLGYYKGDKTCDLCASSCRSCVDGTSCESCVDNFMMVEDTHQCVESCDENGYFQQKTTCKKCSGNCLHCNSEITCNLCNETFYLSDHNRVCVTRCPTGFFENNITCSECKIDYEIPCETEECFRCYEGAWKRDLVVVLFVLFLLL
ncbi:hypothetical protein EIN_419400 [Entamoeba invadens IP1]|uniref:Uncharacterized protein n=1 Tax=Entamoeba invadens IP1 TaxID=370355 RepID=A0A0A1U1W4_ENTIV|nr:hypothetical protein EIN_419400 [Entamoeba invadens IP1]ELP88011.1 hypothetical protein EIN_419400 [Entamoeba invadens IP1]|eukprot:XP_004254782.1 hypothetical protein EIN_419400 [Entamoeba invadens IP1]